MRSLSDKAALLIAANLTKYAVGFVLPMVLVRLLSRDDYGTYQQLVLIGNIANAVMVLGLPVSVYYFYHRRPERRTIGGCAAVVLFDPASCILERRLPNKRRPGARSRVSGARRSFAAHIT